MHLLLPDLAHDTDDERRRVADLADHRHRIRAGAGHDGRRLATVRRGAARALAAVSLASAAAVRHLDACIADELTRPFASTDGI